MVETLAAQGTRVAFMGGSTWQNIWHRGLPGALPSSDAAPSE